MVFFSYVSILTTSIIVVITAIYLYMKRQYNYWKEHGVLYPKPNLLLGNMTELLKFNMTEAELMDTYYKKYNTEKYIGVYNLWHPTLFVRDVDIAKRIMETDSESFIDHTNIRGHVQSDSVIESLYSQRGETWKSRRAIFSRLFTPKKIKEYLEPIQSSLSLLVNDLNSKVDEDIEFTVLLDRHLVRITCTMLYGLDVSNDDETIDKFNETAEIFSKPPLSSVFSVVFYTVSPKLFKLLKVRIYPRAIWDYFSNFTRELISAREQSGVKRTDLVELVMQMRDGILQNEKITFEESVGHLYSFFLGSHHTSEIIVCHILLQLALNPEVQKKVREEVDSVLGGSKTATYEQLSQMTYLEAVINETLRMFPLVGTLKRLCTKTYKLDDKFTVPEGMDVIIPAASIHMDPKNFSEPEKFIPERFYNKEVNMSAWMPFGKGSRTCLGMLLGQLSLKLVISRITDDYIILPSDKMQMPIKFDPRTLFLKSRPLGGFWMKFQQRNK